MRRALDRCIIPWGGLEDSIETVTNVLKFAGREYDPETHLYYNRARYYDPQLARFISEDPIGQYGGSNQYAYVADNPVGASDASGECASDDTYLPEEDGTGCAGPSGGGPPTEAWSCTVDANWNLTCVPNPELAAEADAMAAAGVACTMTGCPQLGEAGTWCPVGSSGQPPHCVDQDTGRPVPGSCPNVSAFEWNIGMEAISISTISGLEAGYLYMSDGSVQEMRPPMFIDAPDQIRLRNGYQFPAGVRTLIHSHPNGSGISGLDITTANIQGIRMISAGLGTRVFGSYNPGSIAVNCYMPTAPGS